jgi:hypothetical protein
MTSFRQIEANRRNALRRTGPKTAQGKQHTRRDALRYGLTAETVIDGLEDSEDYRGFDAAVIAYYDARTEVERELVLRLASRSGECSEPSLSRRICSEYSLKSCANVEPRSVIRLSNWRESSFRRRDPHLLSSSRTRRMSMSENMSRL